MTFDPKVIEALARLRHAAHGIVGLTSPLAQDIKALDNAGVFAALDEQTETDRAEGILAEVALKAGALARDDFEHGAETPNTADPACLCGGSFDGRRGSIGCTEQALDPAEWGDTTSADMARHQGWHPRTPGDLKQSQETSRLDEPLYGAEAVRMRERLLSQNGEDLTAAYSAQEPAEDEGPVCTCGQAAGSHVSLHAGTCPVWARHHNLI